MLQSIVCAVAVLSVGSPAAQGCGPFPRSIMTPAAGWQLMQDGASSSSSTIKAARAAARIRRAELVDGDGEAGSVARHS